MRCGDIAELAEPLLARLRKTRDDPARRFLAKLLEQRLLAVIGAASGSFAGRALEARAAALAHAQSSHPNDEPSPT